MVKMVRPTRTYALTLDKAEDSCKPTFRGSSMYHQPKMFCFAEFEVSFGHNTWTTCQIPPVPMQPLETRGPTPPAGQHVHPTSMLLCCCILHSYNLPVMHVHQTFR